ncbi:TMEM175 family protein [Microbacterium pseudoresistens]|uniref:Putative membrane protein n=1 Tax=Microbacterium pseudoresistens TaxID=640634 RepID=A0A7Y9ETI4_9MICO|nr:TMEM175 family protein [Microbacterium pseudoresistens]NYD53643.1 putative membrane protein [Microbacterium pseudoresistens]
MSRRTDGRAGPDAAKGLVAHDRARHLLPTERVKAFIDAVVAIAMTLLILPLMEGVIELGREGKTVLEYLDDDGDQIVSFLMSFVLIANFWLNHHRTFDRVGRTDPALLWLAVLWMLSIVWLPVPTAMLGAMPTDTVQKVVYIGSLLLTALIMLAIRVYLRRHRDLHDVPDADLRSGVIAESLVCVLFVVAGLVAVLVPAIGYFAMFLVVLVMPLHRLVNARVVRRERETTPPGR